MPGVETRSCRPAGQQCVIDEDQTLRVKKRLLEIVHVRERGGLDQAVAGGLLLQRGQLFQDRHPGKGYRRRPGQRREDNHRRPSRRRSGHPRRVGRAFPDYSSSRCPLSPVRTVGTFLRDRGGVDPQRHRTGCSIDICLNRSGAEEAFAAPCGRTLGRALGLCAPWRRAEMAPAARRPFAGGWKRGNGRLGCAAPVVGCALSLKEAESHRFGALQSDLSGHLVDCSRPFGGRLALEGEDEAGFRRSSGFPPSAGFLPSIVRNRA